MKGWGIAVDAGIKGGKEGRVICPGLESIPLPTWDFNPWSFNRDRLLTHISAAQTQDASVAAAEHAADDVSQDACAHLRLVGQNKGQWASYESSSQWESVFPVKRRNAFRIFSLAEILWAEVGDG